MGTDTSHTVTDAGFGHKNLCEVHMDVLAGMHWAMFCWVGLYTMGLSEEKHRQCGFVVVLFLMDIIMKRHNNNWYYNGYIAPVVDFRSDPG